jgi:hypothetical protein
VDAPTQKSTRPITLDKPSIGIMIVEKKKSVTATDAIICIRVFRVFFTGFVWTRGYNLLVGVCSCFFIKSTL